MPWQCETERYLFEYGGSPKKYRQYLTNPVTREGQAFFVSCSETDKELLRGTIFDPFYGDTQAVAVAIDYLKARHMRP